MTVFIKSWGWEELLECNEHYVVKKIFMRAGHCCSLQYHQEKTESFFLVSGRMRFHYGDKVEILETEDLWPASFRHIPVGMIHRMEALDEDIVYLETSTPQLDDVVRLADKYGRVPTP